MGHVRRARPVGRPALERLMVDATAAWGYSEEFMAAVRRNAQVDHDAIAPARRASKINIIEALLYE